MATLVHGTNSGYCNHACRCKSCVKAHNAYYNIRSGKSWEAPTSNLMDRSILSEPVWRFHGFGDVRTTLVKH